MVDRLPAAAPEWEAIERLLDRALELPPDQQDALLARAGSDDPALAAAVKRLVNAGRRAGTFLEQPAASYAGPLLAWVAGREPLEPGAMLGPYEIVRRLGRGATATVFLARDPKHRRSVAVKVLHPDLAAAVGAERFLREIEIAATLQHPHILPLFDSGAVDGLLYYVMPHVGGESLRQMLSSRDRLPIATALRIATEVAGALDYSHRRGVVHRDIKPENILLQDGQAVVADFGIARALDAAGADGLTEATFGTGTPAYMSPEQIRSEAVDGRSDLYSLGCVVYEMLTGEVPFRGGSPVDLRRCHLEEPVPPMPPAVGIPPLLERAVARSLAKTPADRYETVGAFADALERDAAPMLDGAPTRSRRRLWPAVAGLAAVATAVAATALRPRPVVVPEATRIAVLPFTHAGADTGLARVGQDMAATVNVALDRLGGIATVDRFATMTRTAGAAGSRSVESDVALGRRFGAGSVLTGTVSRAGDDVRVEATLLRSDRPVPVARATVVAPAESLSVLTDSIALQIVRQVWLEGAPPTPSLTAITTASVSSLRSFLDGERALLTGRWREAADDYRAAFTADSGFTLAYARYAEAVTWRRDDQVHEVEADVRRHLQAGRLGLPERDRLLVDARLAADSTPSTRLRLLAEVTRRFPEYWPGWFGYGDGLVHFGLLHGHSWSEARSALRRALTEDPDLVSAWEHLGWTSAAYDSTAFRESVEQRVRLGYYTGSTGAGNLRADRLMTGLPREGGGIPENLLPLADSVGRDRADLAFEPFRWSAIRELGFGFPAAQIELDRRALSGTLTREARGEAVRSLALAWATRGAWDSALANADRFVALGTNPSAASHAYSLAVIGAWLGAIEPAEAVRRGRAATAALPGIPAEIRPIRQLCLLWLDGVVAFVRRDRAGLAAARAALQRLHTRPGDVNADILSAFALALDGRRAAAGQRLAAIEWSAADRPADDPSRYDLLLTRMSAARWLAEAGQPDEAVRLLRAADVIGAGKLADDYVLAGPAHLAAAQLLEAQGDTIGALESYRQFLRRLDRPGPAQLKQVEQAKAALTRLAQGKVS